MQKLIIIVEAQSKGKIRVTKINSYKLYYLVSKYVLELLRYKRVLFSFSLLIVIVNMFSNTLTNCSNTLSQQLN